MATPDRNACAYCGATDRKITREHLWPQALHDRLQKSRGQKENLFWLSRLQNEKPLPSEPVIRDVCEVCNNGPLSELDSYGCSLWDSHFQFIRQRGERVIFSYDYSRLLRWLLKLCFNSARVHRFDHGVYPPLRGLILSGAQAPAEQRLFVQLVPPGLVPPSVLTDEQLPNGSRVYFPDNHRIGFMRYTNGPDQKTLRAVHLRSFSFFIAFFRPGAPEVEIKDFVGEFVRNSRHINLIHPDSASIELLCDGTDAFESARMARAIRFQATPPKG